MSNAPVTANELSTFSSYALQIVQTDKKMRATQSAVTLDTLRGDSCGYAVVRTTMVHTDSTTETGTSSLSFCDYSDNNKIFWGGTVSMNMVRSPSTTAMTVIGTTQFAGEYAGTIIYNYSIDFSLDDSLKTFPMPKGSIQLISGGKTFELLKDSIIETK